MAFILTYLDYIFRVSWVATDLEIDMQFGYIRYQSFVIPLVYLCQNHDLKWNIYIYIYIYMYIYSVHYIETEKIVHALTQGGLVKPYGDIDLGQHWLR